MNITVIEPSSGQTTLLNLTDEVSVGLLKELIAGKLGIPVARQVLYKGATELRNNSTTLKELGVTQDEIIQVFARHSERRLNPTEAQESDYRARARDLLQLIADKPAKKAQITFEHPSVADILERRDEVALGDFLRAESVKRRKAIEEDRRKLRTAQLDPLSPEAQAMLLQEIHRQQIDSAYAAAHEYFPENFIDVMMLYVSIEVNGKPIKAFVDSGAQTTIMSKLCAENCGLMHLVDKRFRGVAQGVGTSRIVGRIHMAQVKMGNKNFQTSFTVIEENSCDFLFGLDLLRRYQCKIDLEANVLRIEDEAIPFLTEKDLKDVNRLAATATEVSSSSSAPPSTMPASQPSHQPESVQQLMALGFQEAEVNEALRATGGDVELAAALLFQQ